MKIWTKRTLTGSGILVASLMVANGLNFVFNAFLGRHLNLEQFGLITFVNTLLYVFNIFFGAIGGTVTHRVSYLSSRDGSGKGVQFFKSIQRKVLTLSIFITCTFILAIPFVSNFFRIPNITVLILFAPTIVAGIFVAINRGYLSGSFSFIFVAILAVLEPLFKLVLSYLFIQNKQPDLVYTAIPFSVMTVSLIALVLTMNRLQSKKYDDEEDSAEPYVSKFPRSFFVAALLSNLSNNIFLTFDVLLIKHFFPPAIAGQYSLLALIGKIIYFLGTLLISFIIAFVSRDLGSGRNPNNTFYKLLAGIIILVVGSVIGLDMFGAYLVPLVFGSKALSIVPYLTTYGTAIGMYTIASAIVTYHLARKHYIFSLVALFMSILMCLGITMDHKNIGEVVNVMFVVAALNLLVMIFLHLMSRFGISIIRNIVDFLCLFLPLPKAAVGVPKGKKILIFNWRDNKHSYAGGAEVYVHELARRWVKKGYMVTMFCGNDGNQRRFEMIDGVAMVRRGGFYTVYIWAFIYYLLRFRRKYDIVLDCQNGIPFFTPLYVKEKIICVMFHVHQEVFHKHLIWPLSEIAAFLEGKMMPWAYRKIKFITISDSTKKGMEKLGLGKAGIEIVHPGVDISELVPGEKSKNPLVLYVGRLKKYKSVETFIRAIPAILKKVPRAKFVIAGDGEERSALMKLTRELNLVDMITFFGKVTQEEKVKLYQQAWVFVNPSMMEGWGITNIEASACGTPVVAADVPGIRDSVRNPHMGFLVEHGNAPAFAEKVTYLLEHDRKRAEMSRNGVSWAARFEWKKSADKSLKVITSS